MKKWLWSFFLVFLVTIISFIYVNNNSNLVVFETDTKYKEEIFDIDNSKFKIYVNDSFSDYNTSEREDEIEYIVIHYTGTISDAKTIIKSYNDLRSKNASADFFVSHDGEIYQYNPNIDKRYSWAVGGDKKANNGGKFYKKVNNENSVSIEMCVKNNKGNTEYNDGWYFTDETLSATVTLVKYLKQKYNIDSSHIVRHYDVTGKECPGVNGWNDEGVSDSKKWSEFLKMFTI